MIRFSFLKKNLYNQTNIRNYLKRFNFISQYIPKQYFRSKVASQVHLDFQNLYDNIVDWNICKNLNDMCYFWIKAYNQNKDKTLKPNLSNFEEISKTINFSFKEPFLRKDHLSMIKLLNKLKQSHDLENSAHNAFLLKILDTMNNDAEYFFVKLNNNEINSYHLLPRFILEIALYYTNLEIKHKQNLPVSSTSNINKAGDKRKDDGNNSNMTENKADISNTLSMINNKLKKIILNEYFLRQSLNQWPEKILDYIVYHINKPDELISLYPLFNYEMVFTISNNLDSLWQKYSNNFNENLNNNDNSDELPINENNNYSTNDKNIQANANNTTYIDKQTLSNEANNNGTNDNLIDNEYNTNNNDEIVSKIRFKELLLDFRNLTKANNAQIKDKLKELIKKTNGYLTENLDEIKNFESMRQLTLKITKNDEDFALVKSKMLKKLSQLFNSTKKYTEIIPIITLINHIRPIYGIKSIIYNDIKPHIERETELNKVKELNETDIQLIIDYIRTIIDNLSSSKEDMQLKKWLLEKVYYVLENTSLPVTSPVLIRYQLQLFGLLNKLYLGNDDITNKLITYFKKSWTVNNIQRYFDYISLNELKYHCVNVFNIKLQLYLKKLYANDINPFLSINLEDYEFSKQVYIMFFFGEVMQLPSSMKGTSFKPEIEQVLNENAQLFSKLVKFYYRLDKSLQAYIKKNMKTYLKTTYLNLLSNTKDLIINESVIDDIYNITLCNPDILKNLSDGSNTNKPKGDNDMEEIPKMELGSIKSKNNSIYSSAISTKETIDYNENMKLLKEIFMVILKNKEILNCHYIEESLYVMHVLQLLQDNDILNLAYNLIDLNYNKFTNIQLVSIFYFLAMNKRIKQSHNIRFQQSIGNVMPDLNLISISYIVYSIPYLPELTNGFQQSLADELRVRSSMPEYSSIVCDYIFYQLKVNSQKLVFINKYIKILEKTLIQDSSYVSCLQISRLIFYVGKFEIEISPFIQILKNKLIAYSNNTQINKSKLKNNQLPINEISFVYSVAFEYIDDEKIILMLESLIKEKINQLTSLDISRIFQALVNKYNLIKDYTFFRFISQHTLNISFVSNRKNKFQHQNKPSNNYNNLDTENIDIGLFSLIYWLHSLLIDKEPSSRKFIEMNMPLAEYLIQKKPYYLGKKIQKIMDMKSNYSNLSANQMLISLFNLKYSDYMINCSNNEEKGIGIQDNKNNELTIKQSQQYSNSHNKPNIKLIDELITKLIADLETLQKTVRNKLNNESYFHKNLYYFLNNSLFPQLKIVYEYKIGPYIIDLYIKEHNLIIECNGKQHYNYPSYGNLKYSEQIKMRNLKRMGYKCLSVPAQIWNSKQANSKLDYLKEELRKLDIPV